MNYILFYPQGAHHTWVWGTSLKWFTILMSSCSLLSQRAQQTADDTLPFCHPGVNSKGVVSFGLSEHCGDTGRL